MATTRHDEFQTLCIALRDESVRLHIVAPVLRDNPQIPSADRTLRKTLSGQLVLRVNRWRDPHEVTTDLIEGILRAQTTPMTVDEEATIRSALWQAAAIGADA